MKITHGLKAAVKAFLSGPEPQSFRAASKSIQCAHCGNILFYDRKASLNTAFSAAINTECIDQEATVLICANCSRMEWFFDAPEVDQNR